MNAKNQKILALTFDDGPSTDTMSRIMALLQKYDAKATFFLVGSNITENTAPVMLTAMEQGHELGNHSQSHRHMSQMDREELLHEVQSVQKQVAQLTGILPALFRPPYLDVDARMAEVIEMPFIGGNGNFDWDPAYTAQQRAEIALAHARDGAILLMHCFEGNDATVDALNIVLPKLKKDGFRFMTVSRLFAEKGIPLQNGRLYNSTDDAQ